MLLEGAIPNTVPKCACPVLIGLLQAFQEGLEGTQAAELAGLTPKLLGTKAGADVEYARTLLSVDYSVRVFLPRALSAVPELECLANELSALDVLGDETHEAYVAAIARAAGTVRNNVANDPLARGAAAMKAVYQVQYLLEQYRIRPYRLTAQVIASAFCRIKGGTSAVELLDKMLDATSL